MVLLYVCIYMVYATVVIRRMGALDCLHDFTIYVYALSLVLVEHSVRHQPIFVLINVFTLLA